MAFSQMTLLEYVQNTLNELHSDQVNTIGSTAESQTIATIARNQYNELLQSTDELKFTYDILQLYGAADPLSPTKLLIPEDITSIAEFNYNATTQEGNYQYAPVSWQESAQFLRMVQARSTSTGTGTTNIVPIDIGRGIVIFVYNDRPPQYYTSFDDGIIYCDAYNIDVEDTLQQQKTEIIANVKQTWKQLDTFIPRLPYNMEQQLLNMIFYRSYFVLRGEEHPQAYAFSKSMAQRSKFISARTPTTPPVVRWGRGGWRWNGPGTY